MNINEVFKRLNAGIAECKEGIAREIDQGRRIHIDGIKTGLEAALKVINDVNFDPPAPSELLNCIGWGERHKSCKEKVPKRFLQLYCDICNKDRLAKSNRPVYGVRKDENYDVIPFTGLVTDEVD